MLKEMKNNFGTLKTDTSNAFYLWLNLRSSLYSANITYMYDSKTRKITIVCLS